MSPRRVLGPALALLLGMGAPCADAASGPATWTAGEDVTQTAEVQAAVAAARAHWGMTIGCLQVVVAEIPLYSAVSYRPCTTQLSIGWLASSPSRPQFCAVIVHEYGHLLGYSHAYGAIDPVMRPVDPPPPAECPQPPKRRRHHKRGR